LIILRGVFFPKAMMPADPKFYLNFVILLILTAVLAVVGGNNGIALGKLIRRNDWLTRSTIRLLRVGMWLPIFLLWSYPSSFLHKPGIFQMLPFLKSTGSAPLLVSMIGGLLATTTVLFGSCYYYLARHLLSPSHASRGRLHLYRDIFLLALLVCLLWQNSYGNGWPYQWIWGAVTRGEPNRFGNLFLYITITSWLAMFLLMIVVFVSNRVFRWSLDGAVDSRRSLLSVELHNTNLRSLLGASLSVVVALLLWQLLNQPLETYLLIPRSGEVLQAMISLLTSQLPTFWSDSKFSLLVILGGIVWAGLFAIPLVELCYRWSGLKRCGGLLALSCISPVVLQDAAILWLGIGAMRMAFCVSCFAFFPLVQGLWSYQHLSLGSRLLISIDETLPYAFLGMLTSEIYASTQGLGFVIATASSTRQTAKTFAASLILFGLLAAISGILRWMIKRAVVRSANAAVVAVG
jgi:ABC-type nitrate/sulfonate/bicarbonate transport system permease component